MTILCIDDNECNFGVRFDDESKKHLVKKAILEGLGTWYQASSDDFSGNQFFTAEEVEGFYDAGYAEPTSVLLKRWNVVHEITEWQNEDGSTIDCDEVVRY